MDTSAIQDIVSELRAKLRHEQERMAHHAHRAEALKTAIRELESLGPEDPPPTSGLPDIDGSAPSVRDDVEGMSTKDLVVWVLGQQPRGDGWTAGDLADHMRSLGWGQDIQNPEEAVRTALVRLEQDDESPVRRVSRGRYALEDPLDFRFVNPREGIWDGEEVKTADAET